MAGLQIVWRNPRLLQNPRRWQRLKADPSRKLYVVHELIMSGRRKQWVYTSALEILRGKRTA